MTTTEARIEALEKALDTKEDVVNDLWDHIEALEAALNYVADMTYCGTDAEWHFKPGYDPQLVLDALTPEHDKP